MTRAETKKALEAIAFLIDFMKRRGMEKGCDPDYDGGSYADDLRGLARTLEAGIS